MARLASHLAQNSRQVDQGSFGALGRRLRLLEILYSKLQLRACTFIFLSCVGPNCCRDRVSLFAQIIWNFVQPGKSPAKFNNPLLRLLNIRAATRHGGHATE